LLAALYWQIDQSIEKENSATDQNKEQVLHNNSFYDIIDIILQSI